LSAKLRAIGLLSHPKKPESITLAERMAAFLHDHGTQPGSAQPGTNQKRWPISPRWTCW